MRKLYDFWKADEAKDKDGNELFLGREKYAIFRDLGLFLFMYLGDGQNLADTLRLTYDELYYATHGSHVKKLMFTALRFVVARVLKHFFGITFHQSVSDTHIDNGS